jgi:hypothetical protein
MSISIILNNLARERAEQFCRPTDEIICIRIFRRSDNSCYFCDKAPLEWHHVLLNTATNQTVDVDLECVIGLRKMLESMGSARKILFFPKYKVEADFINSKHDGTAAILEFSASMTVIKLLLARPSEINYQTLKAILDYTGRYLAGEENGLFHQALDIYVERKYYIYESIGDISDGDNVEKIIEEYLRMEAEQDIEDYHYGDDICASEIASGSMMDDDSAPEGLGSDEVDWDSHDKDH